MLAADRAERVVACVNRKTVTDIPLLPASAVPVQSNRSSWIAWTLPVKTVSYSRRCGNSLASLADPQTSLCKGKGKKITFTLEQATKPSGGEEVWLYSFFNLGARWSGWSTPRPGRFNPGKYPVPIVQEVGGPQGRSGQVRKISPPPGFDPRTVQPLASRCTD